MKKLIIFALIAGAIGGIYGFYLYNKPVANAGEKKVDVEIDAKSLSTAFSANETEANNTYLNKIILVSGVVKSIDKDGSTPNILLDTSNPLSSISCELSAGETDIKVGDQVSMQCQCTGYLMDVVLTKCVKK